MEVMEVRDLKMEYRTVKKEEGIRGSIRHLIKPRYGKKEAVKGVSFSIAQGESVAFLGANGAGKSTTIKMLTGILKPSGGEVSIMGKNPFCDRMENAKKIGVVFGQKTQLWWDIPVIETFRLLKNIYEIPDDRYEKICGNSVRFWIWTHFWGSRPGSCRWGSGCGRIWRRHFCMSRQSSFWMSLPLDLMWR